MTRDFKKLAHSIYECKYHVVFCPKYRFRILKGELGAYVAEKIQKLSKQKDGVEILELNVRPDHVHLVASIAPKYAVSKMMGFLKGKVAISVFQHFPHIGKQYWGRHMWSRTVQPSTEQTGSVCGLHWVATVSAQWVWMKNGSVSMCSGRRRKKSSRKQYKAGCLIKR